MRRFAPLLVLFALLPLNACCWFCSPEPGGRPVDMALVKAELRFDLRGVNLTRFHALPPADRRDFVETAWQDVRTRLPAAGFARLGYRYIAQGPNGWPVQAEMQRVIDDVLDGFEIPLDTPPDCRVYDDHNEYSCLACYPMGLAVSQGGIEAAVMLAVSADFDGGRPLTLPIP